MACRRLTTIASSSVWPAASRIRMTRLSQFIARRRSFLDVLADSIGQSTAGSKFYALFWVLNSASCGCEVRGTLVRPYNGEFTRRNVKIV